MILTGKCKDHFNKYLYHEYFKEYFQYQMVWQLMGETAQNAIIVEWLDLQSIIIEIGKWAETKWQYVIDDGEDYPDDYGQKTRKEVIKAAISKANEIYNLLP